MGQVAWHVIPTSTTPISHTVFYVFRFRTVVPVRIIVRVVSVSVKDGVRVGGGARFPILEWNFCRFWGI